MTAHATLIEYARLPGTWSASDTETVNAKLPVCEGAPVRLPSGANDSPGGRLPALTENVNGATPDCAVIACAYGTPNSPFGSVGGASTMSVFWMRRFAGAPASTPTATFAQSRAWALVTATEPVPSGPA